MISINLTTLSQSLGLLKKKIGEQVFLSLVSSIFNKFFSLSDLRVHDQDKD